MSAEGTKFVQKVQPFYLDENGNLKNFPAQGLPYLESPISYLKEDLLHNDVDQGQLTATNWGVGADAYVTSVTVIITSAIAGQFLNTQKGQGIQIQIYSTRGSEYVRMYNDNLDERGVRTSVLAFDRIRRFLTIKPTKVLSTETIKMDIYNYSGITIDCYISLSAVLIT